MKALESSLMTFFSNYTTTITISGKSSEKLFCLVVKINYESPREL